MVQSRVGQRRRPSPETRGNKGAGVSVAAAGRGRLLSRGGGRRRSDFCCAVCVGVRAATHGAFSRTLMLYEGLRREGEYRCVVFACVDIIVYTYLCIYLYMYIFLLFSVCVSSFLHRACMCMYLHVCIVFV